MKTHMKIIKLQRKKFHPLQHQYRQKYGLSKKTIFFMKEYGPHSHLVSTILKESFKIMLLASIISSLGGLSLESIRTQFVTILPLLIILPALNDMVGDLGIIIVSKFTTALFTGQIEGKWWKIHFLHRLFWMMFAVAIITGIFTAGVGYGLAVLAGYAFSYVLLWKIVQITLAASITLLVTIFLVSVIGGLWVYKRGEDPNNLLIPITTALADLGMMLMLALLVPIFF